MDRMWFQDHISSLCWWCSSVFFTKSWPPAECELGEPNVTIWGHGTGKKLLFFLVCHFQWHKLASKQGYGRKQHGRQWQCYGGCFFISCTWVSLLNSTPNNIEQCLSAAWMETDGSCGNIPSCFNLGRNVHFAKFNVFYEVHSICVLDENTRFL